MKFILASKNKGKALELRSILKEHEIITMAEAGYNYEIDENGKTFEENALIKARFLANKSGFPCIADDSGLEVTALDMRPGIFSARYETTDERRIRKLLFELQGVSDRSARFVSAAAACFPDGREFVCRGEVYGNITLEPRGTGGFGYDPVFESVESGKTFGEMSDIEKNEISHRRRAFEKLKKAIDDIQAK